VRELQTADARFTVGPEGDHLVFEIFLADEAVAFRLEPEIGRTLGAMLMAEGIQLDPEWGVF
jgi:hypothetical protein